MQIKRFMYTCNQINWELYVLINEKKKSLTISKNKTRKSKDRCWLRYLIL